MQKYRVKWGFVKVSIARVVRLQECPLGELPLYNNTTAETLPEY